MTDLKPILADLPEPIPPSSLSANVMARIARAPEPAGVRVQAQATATRTGGRHAWTWMMAGLALVIGVMVQGWWNAGLPFDFRSARVRGVMPMPVAAAHLPLLLIGLWLFLAGLFAPVRRS